VHRADGAPYHRIDQGTLALLELAHDHNVDDRVGQPTFRDLQTGGEVWPIVRLAGLDAEVDDRGRVHGRAGGGALGCHHQIILRPARTNACGSGLPSTVVCRSGARCRWWCSPGGSHDRDVLVAVRGVDVDVDVDLLSGLVAEALLGADLGIVRLDVDLFLVLVVVAGGLPVPDVQRRTLVELVVGHVGRVPTQADRRIVDVRVEIGRA